MYYDIIFAFSVGTSFDWSSEMNKLLPRSGLAFVSVAGGLSSSLEQAGVKRAVLLGKGVVGVDASFFAALETCSASDTLLTTRMSPLERGISTRESLFSSSIIALSLSFIHSLSVFDPWFTISRSFLLFAGFYANLHSGASVAGSGGV